MAITDVLAQSSVLPSAGARATASVAIMPLPPTRFSTTNCWPNASLRREAASRPITSILPPAANGTSTFAGRCGHTCASADPAASMANATRDTVRKKIMKLHRRQRVGWAKRPWRPATRRVTEAVARTPSSPRHSSR
jgi:hypothetical protein